MTWQLIDTEPKDDTPRIVSDDPSDITRAHIVTLQPDGMHFNGDIVLENYDNIPTHWHPIPVK